MDAAGTRSKLDRCSVAGASASRRATSGVLPVMNHARLPRQRRGAFVGFCSRHTCSRSRQLGLPNDCCPDATPCRLAPNASHHILFVHVEKTGGSSVECAARDWAQAGYWTSMGHVGTDGRGDAALRACRRRCEDAGVPTAVVISVRDPYSYWQSVHRFAWRAAGTRLSATYNALTSEFRASTRVSRREPGILATLPSLLGWVEATPSAVSCSSNFSRCLSLSGRIKRACGGTLSGCAADFVLHTETLERDWSSLVARYGLPATPLPHVVPGSGYSKNRSCHCALDRPRRCDPFWGRRGGGSFSCSDAPVLAATQHTAATRAIIDRVEGEVFNGFGYAHSR